MNAHLYRLQKINEIEQEFYKEKIKQESTIQRYHCTINFCDAFLLIVQFCVVLLNVVFLSYFQEILGNISGKILQGLNLLFGALSIFLKLVEKRYFKKSRKHEKKKTLIEKEANTVRNLVSKALSNEKISQTQFEKILVEIAKYRKKEEKLESEYHKMITDIMFPKANKAGESFV